MSLYKLIYGYSVNGNTGDSKSQDGGSTPSTYANQEILMWGLVFTGIKEVVQGWFKTKQAKQEAEAAYHMSLAKGEQDWDLEAQKAARYSWKDEFITVIWFSPLIMAWWDTERAMTWINFVTGLPYWYQFGMFGIIAASFGLRWYFKGQSFKLKKE